jgi:hypothetical protein
MQMPYHPAPGIGTMMPGFVMEPWNPLDPKRVPSLGEMLPAKFSVPENPLIKYISGGECSCSGSGMGVLDIAGFVIPDFNFNLTAITGGTAGWPTYAALAAAVFLAFGMMGGKRRR